MLSRQKHRKPIKLQENLILFQYLARARLHISEIMEELEFHATQLKKKCDIFGTISRMSSLKQLFQDEKRAMSQRNFRKTWTSDLINDMVMAEEIVKKKTVKPHNQDIHDLVSTLMQNSIKGKNSHSSRGPVSEAQIKLVRNFQAFVPTGKKKKLQSLRETSLPIIRGNRQVAKAFRIGMKLCNDPSLVANLKRVGEGLINKD